MQHPKGITIPQYLSKVANYVISSHTLRVSIYEAKLFYPYSTVMANKLISY